MKKPSTEAIAALNEVLLRAALRAELRNEYRKADERARAFARLKDAEVRQ